MGTDSKRACCWPRALGIHEIDREERCGDRAQRIAILLDKLDDFGSGQTCGWRCQQTTQLYLSNPLPV